LVQSLAHPGGNVTGTTYNQPEIAGKMVEVLKDVAPRVSRVAVIWNPDISTNQSYRAFADKAAERLAVALQYVDVRRPEDFRLDVLERLRVDALYVTLDATVAAITTQLIAFASQRKLPSIGVIRTFAERGGLVALGPDMDELETAVASYADRILRGAAPADLPVREPSKFVLTVNAKTAKAIGLTLPRDVLIRANEVIQ
jgi:putative ABC transport system substrate-binding protein